MTKIVFSPAAQRDLKEIYGYIAFRLRNPPSAKRLANQIRKTTMVLAQFPESGSPVQFSGLSIVYRYLVSENYLIFYHLTENTAQIDRILYGKRDYLSILFGNELSEDIE